jgi:hypothetical protein
MQAISGGPDMGRIAMLVLTLMMSGRMMTLAFLHRVGRGEAGDPPAAWLMPLIGDAVIGVTALGVAWLIWRGRGPSVWAAIIAWNVAGLWDALSAYVVSRSVPWPEFFMIQTFGASMFFFASAMHLVLIWLALSPTLRADFLPGARPSE